MDIFYPGSDTTWIQNIHDSYYPPPKKNIQPAIKEFNKYYQGDNALIGLWHTLCVT